MREVLDGRGFQARPKAKGGTTMILRHGEDPEFHRVDAESDEA